MFFDKFAGTTSTIGYPKGRRQAIRAPEGHTGDDLHEVRDDAPNRGSESEPTNGVIKQRKAQQVVRGQNEELNQVASGEETTPEKKHKKPRGKNIGNGRFACWLLKNRWSFKN